jgi:hypothetical protein
VLSAVNPLQRKRQRIVRLADWFFEASVLSAVLPLVEESLAHGSVRRAVVSWAIGASVMLFVLGSSMDARR